MQALVASLKIRYDAVFHSDSDPSFYQNIHHYFDLIEKTPVLKAIFDASENEYRKKHIEIWKEKSRTDAEADVKEELSIRLERFNLFCNACVMFVRIYEPIEDYKNNNEPEDKQDLVALLMIRGIKNIKTKRWSDKTLRMYNKWYEGKRSMYESQLRQTHLLLVSELEKIEGQKQAPEPVANMPLMLNERTGDFVLHGKHGNFSPSSKEFKVLLALFESPDQQASYLALLQVAYPTITEATKVNKMLLYPIIQGLREKLNADAIKNVPRIGYRLVFSDDAEKPKQG